MRITRRALARVERLCLLVTGLALAGSGLLLALSLTGPSEPPALVAARPSQARKALPAPPRFQDFASGRGSPFAFSLAPTQGLPFKRRPAPPPATSAPAPPPPEPDLSGLTLTAVMPGDTLSWAIIQGIGPRGQLLVRPGDRVRESVVAAITPAGVLLARGERTRTLALSTRWQSGLDQLMARNPAVREEVRPPLAAPGPSGTKHKTDAGHGPKAAPPANGMQGSAPWQSQ